MQSAHARLGVQLKRTAADGAGRGPSFELQRADGENTAMARSKALHVKIVVDVHERQSGVSRSEHQRWRNHLGLRAVRALLGSAHLAEEPQPC